MIEVRNLVKTFDGKTVLNDVSICFEAGKCNMIIGASGSGKTVLLKNIMGLLKPDSGEVLYSGTDINKLSFKDRKQLSRYVGILFQGSALFDFATVEENVMFPMEFFTRMSKAEKKEKALSLLNRVGLSGSEKKYPSELSGGMQKRVGIARAIALEPRYLFCDEPNSGLDPVTSIRIDELIADITKEYNITTIVNTHDMNSIMGIGDKISYIYQGSLKWQGSKDDILSSECAELRDFISANALVRGRLKNL